MSAALLLPHLLPFAPLTASLCIHLPFSQSAAWFRGFAVPWFRGFAVPWFRGSVIPWFRGFAVPWFRGSVAIGATGKDHLCCTKTMQKQPAIMATCEVHISKDDAKTDDMFLLRKCT